MRFVRFRPLHLLALDPQAAQPVERLGPEHALALHYAGQAWTGLVGDRPVAAAGLIDQGEGRATAWALLTDEALRHIRPLHREVLRVLDAAPYRRIETTVAVGHHAGRRWAEKLGFDEEGEMRRWFWDGRNAIRYARIREG